MEDIRRLAVIWAIAVGTFMIVVLASRIVKAECNVVINGHEVVDVPLGHTAHKLHTQAYFDAQKVYLEKKKSDVLEHIVCRDYQDYILEDPDLNEEFYQHWDLTHHSVEKVVKKNIEVDKE